MVTNYLEIKTSPAFDFRGTGLDFALRKQSLRRDVKRCVSCLVRYLN